MRLPVALALFCACILPRSGCAEEASHAHRPDQAQFDRFLDLASDDYKSIVTNKFSGDGGIDLFLFQQPFENMVDENLGFRTLASSQLRSILRTKEKIIFDATYSFDRYSRRISPISAPAKRKNFLILTGCSFTYGYGLNDDQTLNYYLSKELPEYFPYNYGIGASGPNTALALMEENKFHEQIPQTKGVMVYVSLGESHMDRATGRLPSLHWLQTGPYYEQKGNELVRNGSFATGRPITTKLYLFVSHILSYFGLGNRVFPPLASSDSDYMCLMVTKMRDTLLSQYPDSRFIYYLHPFSSQPRRLSECLFKNQVEWLQGNRPMSPADWTIELDGHPSSRGNQAIAAEIAAYIRNPEGHVSNRYY